MAAITTAPSERFVAGPLVMRSYTLTAVNNSDTLDVPLIRILDIDITPTTNVACGATITTLTGGNSRITFALGGATSMLLAVWGREG